MSSLNEAEELIRRTVLRAEFRRASFAGVPRAGVKIPWKRILIRPVEVRSERHLQFSYFDDRKDITRNYLPHEIEKPLSELLSWQFSGIHLLAGEDEFDVRISKKGKVLIAQKKVATTEAISTEHNRTKSQPLPEGKADRLLEVLGIMTADGRVKPNRRGKFAQINEFLKQLLHTLPDSGLMDSKEPLRILDCGCGSSELTLAVHHYLNNVLNRPAQLLGIDVNDEVIRKSAVKAERLGANELNFQTGRIGKLNEPADIVLALHACDTATDEALAQAIRSEAKVVLSVPCCHHHLNTQLAPNGESEVFRPMLRHGLLLQRQADLLTDTFRALLLRIHGYRTEVVEFIGSEHTPRNLMLRAVRGRAKGEVQFVEEYRKLKEFWGVTPYLESLLGE